MDSRFRGRRGPGRSGPSDAAQRRSAPVLQDVSAGVSAPDPRSRHSRARAHNAGPHPWPGRAETSTGERPHHSNGPPCPQRGGQRPDKSATTLRQRAGLRRRNRQSRAHAAAAAASTGRQPLAPHAGASAATRRRQRRRRPRTRNPTNSAHAREPALRPGELVTGRQSQTRLGRAAQPGKARAPQHQGCRHGSRPRKRTAQ